MDNVIWKSFRLGDLFEFSSGSTFALKEYNLFSEYREGLVEVVTSSKDNTNQFIERKDIPNDFPIYTKSLTINRNGSIGYCFYHSNDFIIPTGDSYTLLHKNPNFKDFLTTESYLFLAMIITYIFTNDVFGYSYKVNSDRFDREIILLPCLEVADGEDFIWDKDGKHYTLAVEYIKKLMDEAKELREQKTIRLYEAERQKYEAEYKKQKNSVIWKSFRLGDLFDFDSSNQLSLNKKALEVSDIKTPNCSIALITQSEKNNGISGYLEPIGEINRKKMKNYLTYSMHFGLCFYHDYDFVLMDTHGSVFRLLAQNEQLGQIMSSVKQVNYFLSSVITKICKNGIYNYNWLPNSSRVTREIILLPCLEVADGQAFIWEEDGKHYTLAVEYIAYLYLTGKINYNQKLVDNYTYQY